jgi:hypothetical protein
MDDDFTGDVSPREHRPAQQQVLWHRAAGGAPDDPGGDDDDDSDGEDNGNHRTNDWRNSRRRPTESQDGYARIPVDLVGTVVLLESRCTLSNSFS